VRASVKIESVGLLSQREARQTQESLRVVCGRKRKEEEEVKEEGGK
jgi:hypothetical protein